VVQIINKDYLKSTCVLIITTKYVNGSSDFGAVAGLSHYLLHYSVTKLKTMDPWEYDVESSLKFRFLFCR
jgi:hypothetical protein